MIRHSTLGLTFAKSIALDLDLQILQSGKCWPTSHADSESQPILPPTGLQPLPFGFILPRFLFLQKITPFYSYITYLTQREHDPQKLEL
jgi:hypothetical protein